MVERKEADIEIEICAVMGRYISVCTHANKGV